MFDDEDEDELWETDDGDLDLSIAEDKSDIQIESDNITNDSLSNSKKAITCIALGIILVFSIIIVKSFIPKGGGSIDGENHDIAEVQGDVELTDDVVVKIKAVISEQAKVIDNQKRQIDVLNEELSKLKSSINNGEVIAGDKWKQFNGLGIEFDKESSAYFTVTDISSYVDVGKDYDVIKTKSIVKGNISGLVGEYEVEMPYTKASYINKGTVLSIKYKYGLIENRVVIGEIIF